MIHRLKQSAAYLPVQVAAMSHALVISAMVFGNNYRERAIVANRSESLPDFDL